MKELKATDLRIGNYVTHCDYTDGIFKVESITYQEDAVGGYVIDTIGGKNGTWINPINCVEPIELTEEWFIKFGFVKSNRINFRELSPCYLIGSFSVVIRRNSFYVDWIGGNTEIQYVHELQNLYFALTGQELEVKF